MHYLIGIDIGTSGTKTVLFDTDGNTVASHTIEYPLYQPRNGWAEQNPEDWWAAVAGTLKAVIEKSAVNPNDIKGVGLSGQMHGLVMLDEKGNILRNAIIWCDQRTAEECVEITERVGRQKLIEITANPALTGFTASKILWVRNHEPETYGRCRHILLPKDYIRYRLTGVFATEVSDASGMQLLDVPHRCWSDEILRALQIDRELLAEVTESPVISGAVTDRAAELTGLAVGTPVAGGAGDNAAAAVGTGIIRDGLAFTTIGTSGVVFAHTSDIRIDRHGRVHTFCCAVPGCWHVMGVTQAAGLSLKWFRDQFCNAEIKTADSMGIDPYVLLDKEAETVPPGANGLLYLPYLMGERTPHLDPDCRGVFFGLSAIHQRKDMLRAVLEGVGYSLRDCLEVLREMGIKTDSMTACGGGGRSPLWRQMLADIFQCPIQTVNSKEGPALGVALLAGVGTGVYSSVQEACDKTIKAKNRQDPSEKGLAAYEDYYKLYCKLYRDLKDSFSQLQSITKSPK